MLRTRIIPALLLEDRRLVKTVRFKNRAYIGDPANTVRIFNELEVDELLFLDITATTEGRSPNLKVLAEIADECFMPLAYGGGIRSLATAKSIFDIGFEKVAVNSYAAEDPGFIEQLAREYGSQAVVVSIDVQRTLLGKRRVMTRSGKQDTGRDVVEWAKEVERRGAGEILLTSIDREGTWRGFDLELVKLVTGAVSVPVIAHGGAGNVTHIGEVVHQGGASAVALGSMVVFQAKEMGVLVNFPPASELRRVLAGEKGLSEESR